MNGRASDGVYLSHDFGSFAPHWVGSLGAVGEERVIDLTVIENYLQGKPEHEQFYKLLIKAGRSIPLGWIFVRLAKHLIFAFQILERTSNRE